MKTADRHSGLGPRYEVPRCVLEAVRGYFPFHREIGDLALTARVLGALTVGAYEKIYLAALRGEADEVLGRVLAQEASYEGARIRRHRAFRAAPIYVLHD